MRKAAPLALAAIVGLTNVGSAQMSDRSAVLASLDAKASAYGDVALKIWSFAEVGYQETRSSALLQEQLKRAGFAVTAGVAEIPTAFTATWGSGKPVIGIIGDYSFLSDRLYRQSKGKIVKSSLRTAVRATTAQFPILTPIVCLGAMVTEFNVQRQR